MIYTLLVLIFLTQLVVIGILLKGEKTMASDLSALSAQVAQNTTVEESAVTLITGLAAQIADLKNDPAALQALADSLNKSATDLSAAVAANTPAAPSA